MLSLCAGGCTFAPDPTLDFARCGPIWSKAVDPAVLDTRCRPCQAEETLSFSLERYHACVASAPRSEHVRLDIAHDPIRLDIIDGSVLGGPVMLEPALSLRRDLRWQLASLHRLEAALRGKACRQLPDPRLARLLLALRALDACAEGASLRTIAHELLGARDWPGDGECVKSQARRLVSLAEALYHAGPRGILHRLI